MDQGANSQNSPVAATQKYCAQRGTAGWLEARFCQSCGLDMVAASPAATNYTGELSDSDKDAIAMLGTANLKEEGNASGISLGTAWMMYGAGFLVLLGFAVVPVGPLYLPIYLAIGFIMTRIVTRGIIWDTL